MKKIIGPGIAAGMAMLVVAGALGFLFAAIFPSLKGEYMNANLFRPFSDPLVWLMYAAPIVSGLVLAWIWNAVKDGIKCDTACKKWVYFGIGCWVITLPGMVISLGTFPISLLMVATWTVGNLAQGLAGAWVLSKLNK